MVSDAHVLSLTSFCLQYCAYALAIFYGAKLLLRGDLGNVGEAFTYGGSLLKDPANEVRVLFSVVIGTSSITMIAPSIGEFAKAAAAAKSILDMIQRQPHIDPLGQGGEQPKTLDGHISLRNVSFAYPARPTLKVLDIGDGENGIDFEAGKITAIVGASGSGKSTIVGLIERWYDPQEGQILLDGRDIKKLNVRWLRRQIGFVQQVSCPIAAKRGSVSLSTQEPVLFSDTVYNNV